MKPEQIKVRVDNGQNKVLWGGHPQNCMRLKSGRWTFDIRIRISD